MHEFIEKEEKRAELAEVINSARHCEELMANVSRGAGSSRDLLDHHRNGAAGSASAQALAFARHRLEIDIEGFDDPAGHHVLTDGQRNVH